MSEFRLNDVLFWNGKYDVINLLDSSILYYVQVSGGNIGRTTTNISSSNRDHVATMKNPFIVTPTYRQRLMDVAGRTLGEIEPRITFEKLIDHSEETMKPYQKGHKFWKGAHIADITFMGEKYLAEAYWPGYRTITVTKNDSVILTLERKFIISEWVDYLLLRRFFIEKSQYDLTIHDSLRSRKEYVLLALMVRQFFRHHYGKRN